MSSRTLATFFRRSIGLAVRYFASHTGHVQAPHPQLPMHRARKRVAVLLLSLGLGVAGVFGGIYCFNWWMDGGNLEPVQLPPGRTASPLPDDRPLEVYTFGVVPQFDTRQLVSVWLPLLKQVEMRAGCRLEFKGTKDIPTFELEFEKGNFDFAYMNPYHSTVAWKTQKYEPLIRDHSRKLFGILAVKEDSPYHSVADLNGSTISFPAPNAMGASLLMRAELRKQHQLDFQPLYAKKHDSVYLSVVSGKCVAGGGVMSTLNQQDARVKDKLRVIYETQKLAPHPIVSHPRVPAEVVARVQQAFYDLADAPCCKQLLASVPMNSPGPATREDYQDLEELGLEEFYVSPE